MSQTNHWRILVDTGRLHFLT